MLPPVDSFKCPQRCTPYAMSMLGCSDLSQIGNATGKETVTMEHINALIRVADEQCALAEYSQTLRDIKESIRKHEKFLHDEKQRKVEKRSSRCR